METLLASLRAASESTRLRILALLSHGELTVSEIVHVMEQSQPRVSRHLKLLCDAGLLDRFQEGTWVFYRLAGSGDGSRVNTAVLPLLPRKDDQLLDDETRLQAIRKERFEEAQAYFRSNADKWNEIRALYVSEELVEAALLDLVPEEGIGAFLDVGTGTGRMLELFADRVDSAIGIDVSRDMLEVARQNLVDKGLTHCQARIGNMYGLDVPEGSQDLVMFHQVLHFADEPIQALKEVQKALSANGIALVADFAPHDQEFLREEHAHRRLGFSEAEMARWAKQAGLNVTATRHLEGDPLKVIIWRLERIEG